MTGQSELYELSVTDRRETLAKLRPVNFARKRRISLQNYSGDGLFYLEKNPQNNKNLFSFKTSFQLQWKFKLFRGIEDFIYP